jgi:DNA repair exonuclease SbcCD ATPase subunit
MMRRVADFLLPLGHKGQTMEQKKDDSLNQTPYVGKQPFRHFARKRLLFHGTFLKLPLFERAIISRFRKSPEAAKSFYAAKKTDERTFAAIEAAASRYKERLGQLKSQKGAFDEEAEFQEDALAMLQKRHGSIAQTIQHLEGLRQELSDFQAADKLESLRQAAARFEAMMKTIRQNILRLEEDKHSFARQKAAQESVSFLKARLSEAGMKNRLGEGQQE